MTIIPIYFLGHVGKDNVFHDILERKKSFLGYKNQKFKKSLNLLNPWFWSTDGYFSKPFFRQYRPGKCLFGYFTTRKLFSRLEKQKIQNVEKLTFLQWR